MEWYWTLLMSAGTVLVSLLVTALFNYFKGLPKKVRDQKEREEQEKADRMEADRIRDEKIARLEEAVSHYPEYRAQSLRIQDELHCADVEIVALCQEIKTDLHDNREVILSRLNHLEDREKNSLRAKILEEYRIFTDEAKNPMHAWSEMEHHSFFKLVKDYEDLGGNDYVHEVVLPEINRLHVIPMSDLEALKELYTSRKI